VCVCVCVCVLVSADIFPYEFLTSFSNMVIDWFDDVV